MHVDALEYWGRDQLPEGGHRVQPTDHDREPTYAQEIQTPELGFGFDGILRERAADLVGILNGIDYDQWDPARDPHLPEPFERVEAGGEGRGEAAAACSDTVCRSTRRSAARPLVGMISRLVDQKGFDLLATLADELPRLDATFVLLGTGERRYEDLWLGAGGAMYPDRIGARIGFDEGLAHLIEGGADLFLMPSRFEPCGLNQMYSLRYGTVPWCARPADWPTRSGISIRHTGEGTGSRSTSTRRGRCSAPCRWALSVYQDRTTWRRIQRRGHAAGLFVGRVGARVCQGVRAQRRGRPWAFVDADVSVR